MKVDVKVMIVDDHAVFRRGLREVLQEAEGIDVVAEAGGAGEALEQAAMNQPNVILMDIDMRGESGIDATRHISQLLPDTQIIMLTVSTSDRNLFEAVKAGAVGYLTKDISPDALVKAIRGARAGEIPMSRRMASRMLDFFRQPEVFEEETVERPAYNLSPREEEILALIAGGARDKNIADKLAISEATAKKHVQNILRKLHVRNRAQAAAVRRTRPVPVKEN